MKEAFNCFTDETRNENEATWAGNLDLKGDESVVTREGIRFIYLNPWSSGIFFFSSLLCLVVCASGTGYSTL